MERQIWYILRDLKRSNAKMPAYKELGELGFELFTPLRWKISDCNGKKVRREVPYIPDLLFVHSEKPKLDEVIERISTLQYRYLRGGAYCEPMTVREEEMNNFLKVARTASGAKFYKISEIKPEMIGKPIRIVGSALNGVEGKLLSVRGSKKKRIYVEIPGLIAVSTEVSPEFIELI